MTLSPDDFGNSFKKFMDQMSSDTASEEPALYGKLFDHMGQDLKRVSIIDRNLQVHEHPNLQLALEEWLATGDKTHEVTGVISQHEYMGVNLSQIVASVDSPNRYGGELNEGPVEYVDLDLDGRVLTCVRSGLYLVTTPESKLAVFVNRASQFHMQALKIQVMARTRAECERFMREIRSLMHKRSVYRGKIISLAASDHGLSVEFHRLPPVTRASIILPEGLLARIERLTIGFSRLSERMLAAKRHLKRGLLFHGPPGTGKTLTAMYLASSLPNHTVILITGRGMGLIEHSCVMARSLQPAVVILEDVDLIGEERTRRDGGCGTPLLFELLNQMDGLAEDCDVQFLLTTNRPDILEPALASRPGRIDQAFEIPVPDADCRKRLFELYSSGLKVQIKDWGLLIKRTQGASAAFIRELMRKAALFAAEDSADVTIEERHMDEALGELVFQGGELTKSLLGFKSP